MAYPDKPVRIIVPFPAGSGADLHARTIGAKLSDYLGQPFVVENKPGAYGQLAAIETRNALPDGLTIGYLLDGPMATMPAGYAAVGMPALYNPTVLQPIGSATYDMFVVIVRSGLPVRSLRELIDYSKSRPDGINFSSGNTSGKVGIAQLNGDGADIHDIPYKSEDEAYTALQAGTVDGAISTTFRAAPFIKNGSVRALATIGLGTSSLLPDVPTAEAAGFPELAIFEPWGGFFGPPGLPKEIVSTLNAALKRALEDPGVRSKLAGLDVTARSSTPDEFEDLLKRSYRDRTDVLKKFGVNLVGN
jgi:tripartite-type tricarboxylate transporter receptor subunit TctC